MSGRGVLDVNRTNPPSSSQRSRAQMTRVLLALLLLTLFFYFVVWRTVQKLMHSNHAFVVLFPISGAAYLFLVMPLATCFAFPDDLPKSVNPLKPSDYSLLLRKTWSALRSSERLKVEGKNL